MNDGAPPPREDLRAAWPEVIRVLGEAMQQILKESDVAEPSPELMRIYSIARHALGHPEVSTALWRPPADGVTPPRRVHQW